MKVRRKRATWPPQVVEMMWEQREHYTIAGLTRKINSTCGTSYAPSQVQDKLQALGITLDVVQSTMTLSRAAAELGIEVSRLWFHVKRQGIPTKRQGKHVCLTEESWERVQKHFVAPPVPTMSALEAANRLHRAYRTIKKLIAKGEIRSWRDGIRVRVAVADVERIERQQRGIYLIGERRQA